MDIPVWTGELAMERLIDMMDDPLSDVLKISTGTCLLLCGTTAPQRAED